MKRNSQLWVAMLAVVALVAACGGGGETSAPTATAEAPPAEAAGSGSAGDGGSIAGVVAYRNGDPDMLIDMNADPVCLGLHEGDVHTESVVLDGEGHLANVFVYVKEGAAGGQAAPSEAHVMDQQGCQYGPHVSGMMVGQALTIRNSDPTLHNVHALPKLNKEFNTGQPFQGMEFEHTFDTAEVMIRFKCDVHPWMSSYLGVLDHPYFGTSGGNGAYGISDLPAGDYVLEAWHEELGTRTANVTVTDGATAQVDFDFSPESG